MVLLPCRPCCNCGCETGELPYTITVTFADLENQTQTRNCDLEITGTFGSGATGVVLAPGGCDDDDAGCGESNRGPITSVLLTNGGSCYARFGRKEPTLTIAGSGAGAVFTPTLAAVDGSLDPQCRSYELASVTVSGGTGYVDGEQLTIRSDGTTVTPAVATVAVGRSEPTLAASVTGGTGAVLVVTTASNNDSPETWGVASVSVTSGGTGYPFAGGEPVYLSTLPVSLSGGTAETAATATAIPEIEEPTTISVFTTGNGTGFSATLAFSPTTDGGRDVFTVDSITITDGGSGYQIGDTISLFAGEFDAAECGSVAYTVDDVDGSGAVTQLSAPTVEVFFARLTGAIASVSVDSGGAYYEQNGTPTSVTVTTAGEYFTVDPTQPACVAEVTVTPCGGGSGAVISATVDDDTTSPTFGHIIGLTVDDGGSDYLAWRRVCSSHASLNGLDFVLTAVDPKPLVTLCVEGCFGGGGTAAIEGPWNGTATSIEDTDPAGGRVTITSPGSGYAKLGREVPAWTHEIRGYTFTPVWGDEQTDDCGLPYWSIESMTITAGENATPIADGFLFWPRHDQWDRVAKLEIASDDDGVPQSVSVIDGGRYYHENPALPPHVASTTVAVYQRSPSAGSGAAFTATINDTPGDPEFGTVTGITITNGGSGYSLYGGPRQCEYAGGCADDYDLEKYPTVTVRLARGKPLEVWLIDAGGDAFGTLALPAGPALTSWAKFVSVAPVTDCDALPDSASLWYGDFAGSVTIAAGGTPGLNSECQTPCDCPLDDVELDEATAVEVTSDFQCSDGPLSATGTWGDLVALDGLDGNNCGGAESTIAIDLACCHGDCTNTGDCVQKILVTFYAYLPHPPFEIPGNALSGSAIVTGSICTDAITVNSDGTFSGTVVIPCDVVGLVGQADTVDVTVTFG